MIFLSTPNPAIKALRFSAPVSEGVAFGVGDARGSVVAAPVSDEGVAVGVRLNDATGIA